MWTFLAEYSRADLIWIAAAIFLLGISKGGIPVGQIALQMLVVFWPGQHDPTRTAIAFMLPSLCVMDIVAVWFYRKDVEWKYITPLFGWSLLGTAIASIVFVSRGSSLVVPDRLIKLSIGVIGLLFVLYQFLQARLARPTKDPPHPPSAIINFGTGLSAGIVSTLAHAAGPILQMYLMPRQIPKRTFVAVSAFYFAFLNLIKLVPFTWAKRIEPEHYLLTLLMLPLIPIGVLLGYLMVRIIHQKHFDTLIYIVLLLTSLHLVLRT